MARPADAVCPQINAEELGRIFGVSRRMVYKWAAQGMPREGRLYDVAQAVQWRLFTLTERADEEPTDIMEARRQLYVAQTAKTQLETERLRGRLVEREEAEGLLLRIGGLLAAQLDAVGPRLAAIAAPVTDQKTLQTLLFDEHRTIRESLADAIMGLSPPGIGDGQAPAEADSGPVGGHEADTAA